MIKLKLIGALAIGAITVASLSATTYAMENNYTGFLTNDIYGENIYYSKNPSNINDSKINKSFKIGKSNLGLEDAVKGYGNSWLTEGTYFNADSFDSGLNKAKAIKYVPWTAVGVNDKNGNGYLDEEDVADVKDNLLNKFSANPITEEFLLIYPTTYYKVNTYDKNKLTDELNANLELKEKMDETRTLVNKIRALTEGQKFSKSSPRYQVTVDGETYTISGKKGEAIKLFNEADVITPENVYSYNRIYKGTEVNPDKRIYQFLEFDVMNENANVVYYDEYNLPYTENYCINFFNGTELVQGTLYPEASVVYTEHSIESLRNALYDKYEFWYKGMSNYSEKSKAISPEYAEALKTIAEMEKNANTNNTSSSFEERQRIMWEDEVASYKKIGYIFTDENAYYAYRASGMSIEEARDLTAYFSPSQSMTNGYNDFVNNKEWYEEQARKMGEENFFDTLSSYADSLVDWFKTLFNTASNDKYKDQIED